MDAARPPEAARVDPHPAVVVLRGVERGPHASPGEMGDHSGGGERLLRALDARRASGTR
jgi:hypothetical protein